MIDPLPKFTRSCNLHRTKRYIKPYILFRFECQVVRIIRWYNQRFNELTTQTLRRLMTYTLYYGRHQLSLHVLRLKHEKQRRKAKSLLLVLLVYYYYQLTKYSPRRRIVMYTISRPDVYEQSAPSQTRAPFVTPWDNPHKKKSRVKTYVLGHVIFGLALPSPPGRQDAVNLCPFLFVDLL